MSRKTRKLMWSVPLIAAVAVIGALAAFMTLVPNPAAADGAPGPVTGLNASEIGRHHVVLNWTAPATGTVTGYRIDISSDAFVWELREADTGSDATSYRVGGLDAGKEYYFRVFALNGDHTGPYSIRPLNLPVTTAAATTPDAVTGLTATDNLVKMITLTWQQPEYNGGAEVARYCIRVRGIQTGASFDITTACTATTDATAETGIAAAITAVNPPQAAVTTIIVEAEDVEAEDGSATWTLAKSDKGTPNDDSDDVEMGDGVTADFQVVAVNTAGQSIASNIDEGKTAAATPVVPDPVTGPAAPPANLKIVGVGDGSNDNTVYLYWNRPADLSETGVTVQVQRQHHRNAIGWRPISPGGGWVDVEHNTAGDATNGLVAPGTNANYSQHADAGAATDIDNALTDNVRYRVRYVENELTSAWVYSQELSLPFPQAIAHSYDSASTTASVDTVGTVASLPVIAGDDNTAVDGDQGLRVVNDMGYFHRIDLAWDRNQYCRVGDGDDDDSLCDTTGQPSTYAVDVIAGDAPPGETAGADADWDFLTDTISASRTRYEHHSSGDEGATVLVSDETRYYRVFPWHGGRYGYPVIETGMTKQADVPDRIPALRVTANGDTKLDLDWDAASNDGGSPVTGYIIQVSADRDNNSALATGATWCDVEHQEGADNRTYTYDGTIHSTDVSGCADSADPPAAPLTATGEALAAGYGRWFRVIPLNKKSTAPADVTSGWTIDSDSQNAIPAFGRTGAADPITPAERSAPSAPIGLVAETALNVHSDLTTDKGVLLTWDIPESKGTADITDYVIQVSVDGGDWETLEDGVRADRTDWTHSTPLPTATEQRAYQVAAKNEVGTGPWSNTAHYSTTSMVDPAHSHNTAPEAVGTIDAQTVTEGEMETMDIAGYFSDADAGDTLTYTAVSDMPMYATASVAGSMLTINGVAAGSATITVTATDAAGESAMQTIMVTVEQAMLTAPSGVTAVVDETDPRLDDVIVSWTPGQGADSHDVVLYSSGPAYDIVREATDVSGNSHKFDDLDPGRYAAVVISARGTDEWDYALVWVEVQ